jgi:hypothetical protein
MKTITTRLQDLQDMAREAAAALPLGCAYVLYSECAERIEAGRSVDCDAYRALLDAQRRSKLAC